MDSLIFRSLIGLNFPEGFREDVQIESSVVKIQIDSTGSTEDVIHVENPEQSQSSARRVFGLKKKFKSSSEMAEISATGFRAAARQWKDADSKPWCTLEGYHIFDTAQSKPTTISIAIRYMKKELVELSGRSSLLWSQTFRRLHLESGHGGLRGIR
jgi:hypothetical protein